MFNCFEFFYENIYSVSLLIFVLSCAYLNSICLKYSLQNKLFIDAENIIISYHLNGLIQAMSVTLSLRKPTAFNHLKKTSRLQEVVSVHECDIMKEMEQNENRTDTTGKCTTENNVTAIHPGLLPAIQSPAVRETTKGRQFLFPVTVVLN